MRAKIDSLSAHRHFEHAMLRLLQRLILPFVLATAGMLAFAGTANAHTGHGGNARSAAVHTERHETSRDVVRHDAAQHEAGSHTAMPRGTAIEEPQRASATADAPAMPRGNGDALAMDAGCCAVTCHSAVGAPFPGALADLAVVRIVPASAVRTLHGSGTGGTERPPRLG